LLSSGIAGRILGKEAATHKTVTEVNFELLELNEALINWERVYNTIRPHQALGYLTPLKFLEQYQQKRREVMCH